MRPRWNMGDASPDRPPAHRERFITADGAAQSIVGTPEHPVFVPAREAFVPLGDLRPGTILRTTDGGEAVVRRVRALTVGAPVYNIEVSHTHTYFAGGDALARGEVLVHNTCNVSDRQFTKKWAKHSRDYGFSEGDRSGRGWYRNRIDDVFGRPDERRRGDWHPNGGGGTNYLFYRSGNDLLVTQPDGSFVTLFPMGAEGNRWFNAAEIIR